MKNHDQNSAELLLSFETEPDIPTVDPTTFVAEEISRPEVNEEKINETIRQVRFFFADWTKITDRPVAEGDFVLLDVDVIEQEPHTPLFSSTRFEVSSKYMAQWMKDLVMGRNAGDSIEGTSTPDEDAKDKEDFKPQKVRG
jgi:FKBP-type peptidyl-prolyl cis-trans isomerase (trigger factor)